MFNFIRKLFIALNSSSSPWQISSAIVLAMFAGFLPSNSLILLDILFLALILNINFGLFLLFTVLFGGIGYLFDPIFESIGYSILTADSLNTFFTHLYNSALFRWSSFNYTLVTGSLLVSTLLAIPMLFVLNYFVTAYRDNIGKKLNEWKLTRWMKLFNNEETSTSIFRLWGLGVFGGLFALILLIMIFLLDPLIRIGMEKGLSYSLKTQVDIRDFKSNISDLSIKVSGIQIADKDMLTHNLIQIKDIEFDLGFSALLEKKAMIENMSVHALAFNTKRAVPAEAYSHAAKDDKKEGNNPTTSKSLDFQNPFTMPDVNTILSKEELKSVTEANKLKDDIEKTKEKWANISKDIKNEDEISKIKEDAKTLENNLKNADVSKILSAKNDIDNLISRINNLKNRYKKIQNDFNEDQKRIRESIYSLKNLPQEDIERIKNKYSLTKTGGVNIISMIIGDEVGKYINKAIKYYEIIKPYISTTQTQSVDDSINPPRGEGRWIKYTNHSNTPELFVKNADIDIVLQNDSLKLNVKNLSSNQNISDKPMLINADAKGDGYKNISAKIIDDRRVDKEYTSLDISVKGFKSENINLNSLSISDNLINANLIGEIRKSKINARSNVDILKSKLSMPSQKMIDNLLSGISKFNLDIFISGNALNPKINIKSDLDQQLSSGLKSMLSNATKGFESDLTAAIIDKAGMSSQGLSSNIGDIGSILNSKQGELSGINTNFSPTSGASNFLKKFF